MKAIIVLGLTLTLSLVAWAATNDLRFTRATGTTPPFASADVSPVANGLLGTNASFQPIAVSVGPGLTMTSATLSAQAIAKSFSYPTRGLNACFQPSATRDALVTYAVDIAANLSLTSGQQGTVYLETFTDSGCTTGAQEITRFVNGNTGSLTVGLNLTQNATGTLSGVVQGGLWAKLRTQSNTGTPAFNYRSAQEVLL